MNRAIDAVRSRAGKLLGFYLSQGVRRFERRLCDPRTIQRKMLFQNIRRCADSQFGSDHLFRSIKTLEDFRNQVPVADFDYYNPYIKQVAEGNVTAMFPAREKIMMFALSSGTTGDPKLIPVNRIWLNQFRRSWQLWGIRAFLDHPALFSAKVLNIVGSCDVRRTSSNIPCGQVSGLCSRIQNPLLRSVYAVPSSVLDIPDVDAREYVILRLAITKDVGLLSTAIPATLVKLAKFGDAWRETIIRDVADGTLCDTFDVPATIRQQIDRHIRVPNRKRAKELEAIVDRTGRLLPKDYWPLSLVACWLGGTVGTESKYLSEYYGDVPRRDIGLLASEGRFSIPMQDGDTSGVLDISSHYYEFIPEEEMESAQPTILECHELKEGENYFLLLTTANGLYRYNIGDVVRCTGYVGKTPQVEFLSKGRRFSDLVGEKITEFQLTHAVSNVSDQMGLRISRFAAVPIRPEREAAYYAIVIEEQHIGDHETAKRFLDAVDASLIECNYAYQIRRADRYLHSPRLVRIRTGGWSEFDRAELKRRGAGQYQYKPAVLLPDESFLKQLSLVNELDDPKSDSDRKVA